MKDNIIDFEDKLIGQKKDIINYFNNVILQEINDSSISGEEKKLSIDFILKLFISLESIKENELIIVKENQFGEFDYKKINI